MSPNPPDTAFAERFRALVQAVNGPTTVQKLGPWLGVSPTQAWYYRTGENLPSIPTAIRIARKLNCCVEYLLTGNGPKRPASATLDRLTERFSLLDGDYQNAVLHSIEVLLITQQTAARRQPS